MITCSPILQSGLGNILFKVAAAYAYSLRYNYDFCIYKNLCQDSVHGNMIDYFENILKYINIKEFSGQNIPIFKEQSMVYREIENFNQDVCFYGDFQSELYFLDFKEQVKNLFFLDNTKFNGKGYCSIHVRRGDYLGLAHFYEQIGIDFYKKSIDIFDKDMKFLIFSNDIGWCKNNFTENNGFKNIEFSNSSNSNYIDLELMSKCEHNITTNSTFSWWAAYLNKNKNKKIITPKQWITQHLADLSCEGGRDRYMDEVIPKEWIRL
jgi:hypothetical protein